MTSEKEIKHGLLDVCKVKGWDSDINILGFHVLCDKLKQLGVDEEREACARVCDELNFIDNGTPANTRATNRHCAAAIRARGNT